MVVPEDPGYDDSEIHTYHGPLGRDAGLRAHAVLSVPRARWNLR